MPLAALIVFGVSLGLIILLFILKKVEVSRGARFAEGLRTSADEGALNVKHVLVVSHWYLEHSPWFVSMFARYGIHFGALSFARLARLLEAQAYNLADFVSHKRNFERRETKSHFLKQVSGHAETVSSVQQTTDVVPAVSAAAPETFVAPLIESAQPVVAVSEPAPTPKRRRSRKKVAQS